MKKARTTSIVDPATLEKLTATEERRLKQNERLIAVMHVVEEQIKIQNSLKLSLLRGALYGLGTVIGATVLIAVLGWFLANTVGSLDNFPFISEVIDQKTTY